MIDPTEVQSLVLHPHAAARLDLAFLHCPTRQDLVEVLSTAAAAVTPAAEARSDRPSVNLGVIGAGIDLLDVGRRARAALPAAFLDGMRLAATRNGDVGPSAPEAWVPPFAPDDPPVHAVALAIGPRPGVPTADAPDWGGLAGSVDHLSTSAARWTGASRPGGIEPFGFRDGISSPTIEGSGRPVRPGAGVWDGEALRWRAVRAGEALLGHVDESGAVAGHPDAAHLERDGSYLVVRRLEQDVEGFRAACASWAEGVEGLDADDVADRIVGRRRDGTVLGQRPGEEPTNDFLYRDGGPQGRAVPPSSHIRRSHPRDDVEHADRIVPRHQLFRRGIPYADEADGTEGLLFLALCADLRRQFELVQSHWLQDGNRFGLGPETDPLTGQCPVGGGPRPASITGPDGGRVRTPSLPSFVTTRGGEYVLLPSRTALRTMAARGPRP